MLPPGGWESSVLFYAGRTKPMGVHTYQVWSEHGGRPERACYLSDREAILRFDAGGVELDILAQPP